MDKIELKGISAVPKKVQAKARASKIQGRDVVIVQIDGVELSYLKQENINYDGITSLTDVITLEQEHNILIDIKPKLYGRFLTKTQSIRTFVSIGDTVEPNETKGGKTSGPGFILSSFNLHGVVKDIRFAKLDDMTVIVADVNNEAVLSYYLRKVQNDG